MYKNKPAESRAKPPGLVNKTSVPIPSLWPATLVIEPASVSTNPVVVVVLVVIVGFMGNK